MLSSLVLIFAAQTTPALAPVSVDNDFKLDAQHVSQPLNSDANLDVLETGKHRTRIRINEKLELSEVGKHRTRIRIGHKLELSEAGKHRTRIRIGHKLEHSESAKYN
jgi:hypothetical protein